MTTAIVNHGIMGGPVGPNEALVLNGQTIAGVAHFLSGIMDRHVIDKTAVDSKFVICLEYAPDESAGPRAAADDWTERLPRD